MFFLDEVPAGTEPAFTCRWGPWIPVEVVAPPPKRRLRATPTQPEQVPGRLRVFSAEPQPWLWAVLGNGVNGPGLSGAVRRLPAELRGLAVGEVVPAGRAADEAGDADDDPPYVSHRERFESGSGPCERLLEVTDASDDQPLGTHLAVSLSYEIPRPDLDVLVSLEVRWFRGDVDEAFVTAAADDFARGFVLTTGETRG